MIGDDRPAAVMILLAAGLVLAIVAAIVRGC